MEWDVELITLYLEICKEYESHLQYYCERFTNGGRPRFSDEEVMLIYCWGISRGFRTIKALHQYIFAHYSEWFPSLPKYSAFVDRLNRLGEAFRLFIFHLQSNSISEDDERPYIVDSFPIMLAQHQHAYTAQVSSGEAGKSYCSTKKLYYHGIKLHAVVRKTPGSLPELEIAMLEKASRQDGPVFDEIRSFLHDNLVFGDKAYKRPDEKRVELEQNIKVITPVIKKKGQKKLEPEKALFSKNVSRMRQPIEAFFAWLNKKTGLQNASCVRSTKGLLVHVFGRIASALVSRKYALN